MTHSATRTVAVSHLTVTLTKHDSDYHQTLIASSVPATFLTNFVKIGRLVYA